MLTLNDINNIEFDQDISEAEYFESIQRAINSGAWTFQGSYGRAMMEAINAGKCLLGLKAARDYYGNTIPSRLQVEDGTEGSWEFVKQRSGAVWANSMAGIK